jgi:hypothetical protein
MGSAIVRCPRCQPPAVRRADGSKIVGWLPESLYVGYLKVDRRLGAVRPPRTCPECGHLLVEKAR